MQTIALHHILLKSPLLAQDVAKELELGADFSELAREYSACPSAKEGGFAGFHQQDDLPIEIINALATHDDKHGFTGPVTTGLGFHLLKPVGEKPKLALSDQLLNAEDSLINQQRHSAEELADEISKTAEVHENETHHSNSTSKEPS